LLGEKSGWLGFAVDDTQKSDEAMSSGIALIAAKAKKYTLRNSDNKKNIESILPLNIAI